MKTFFKMISLLLLMISMNIVSAEVAEINDRRALGELATGKGVFLVDIGDAKKLNFYLEVIQGTHKSMQGQGVKPDFILVYIGPSVKYLTSEPKAEVESAAGAVLMDIESNIEKLAELGIRQEVCSVATEVFGIDNKSVFEDLQLIGDGFISLIGYQAQGYHMVPVF